MVQGFHRRGRHGSIVVGLDDDERRLLTIVFSSLIALLEGEEPGATPGAPEQEDPTDEPASASGVPTAEQLTAMLGMDSTGQTPEDPALRRLFPDVDPSDPERSEEFRRYTEQGLREAKVANLRTVLLTLGRTDPIALADSEAQAWLQALNDMRLVTAVRLGIETEEDWENLIGNGDSSDDITVTIYDFLSWIQESLVEVLMADVEGGA